MVELTKAQKRVLDFIQGELQAGHPTPTHREIAAHFGFASPRAAACHLEALKRKGFIESAAGKARSLRITSPLTKLRGRTVDIPILGDIPAGFTENADTEAEGCVSVDIGSVGFTPSRNTFAVMVRGVSMIGRHIMDGDIVILEPRQEARHGQVVAALIDGERTLKTFVIKNGKSYLKAENPKYPDLIPAHELVIQGVFKALIRRARD